MELILQTGLEHQQKPVDAISGVLKDVRIATPTQHFENPTIDLTDFHIAENIKHTQDNLHVHTSMRGKTPSTERLLVDIKMETGTGKTYVYTNAIYELHKRYGINKFIVAVPTLPIKAGAKQFLSDPYVEKYFQNTCGYNATIDLCVLNAMKIKKGKRYFPSVVRDFVEGSFQNRNKIYVLLVNMNLLTSGNMLSRDDYDYGVQGFYRPFDAIKATKPFVIIDEPHRFSKGQSAYTAIEQELNPQCIIRFGATFPSITTGRGRNKITTTDYQNLLYDLNACEAFNLNLIKGVAKEHFNPISGKDEKVKILSIVNRTSVTFNHKTVVGKKSHTLTQGDSLGVISPELSGLTIAGIGNGFIELSNGQVKETGEEFEVDIYSESYQEQMMRLAIQRHFETERANFERGIKIKTLALFFIDNIESFRGGETSSPWLRDMFDRLLEEKIKEESAKINSDEYKSYLDASLANISACRAGYFSQDNSDSDEEIAKEVDEILHNKKKLLSFVNEDGTPNTRRFLFSKWTLKEGWDNPNVFTITKLRSSGSENSKIQEVGRGLRLPVDEYGNRIGNEEFMLNYIVDFTEADFANKLVAQINAQLPVSIATAISQEDLIRVAKIRGMEEMALMMTLYQSGYITDSNRTINQDKLDDFYRDYPEFNTSGVSGSKVLDRNKKITNTVKIRSAQFEELKELWEAINRKYVIFFGKEVDALIESELPKLFANGVFADTEVTSQREIVQGGDSVIEAVSGIGATYIVKGRRLPYNVFVKRLNKATSIPVNTIHTALCKYVATQSSFDESYFNESSLGRIIGEFDEWKSENLQGKFNYKQTTYTPTSTALTNIDGTIKSEIVQGSVGIHLEKGNVSDKYLYDAICYDSPLEKKNILEDISEVVVYGKIPRRSISIPTIADSSYSPDFMYVVKKATGEKELNIVVETKDVEGKQNLRGNEETKIKCAELFFQQLKIDGYNVHFKTQINSKGMKTIISELMK